MYCPSHFREDRKEILQDFIAAHPLGLLITAGPGGLMANAIPFRWDAGEGGSLRAHLARANPQVKEVMATAECLVVFMGPEAYVTPTWYPSKAETGKGVPTWNYAQVQVRGRPRLVEDEAWLRQEVGALTRQQEAGRPEPWGLDDGPADFIANMMKGIVGLEIAVTSLAGKWKASQNRSAADRAGVIAGLEEEGGNAAIMAALMNGT